MNFRIATIKDYPGLHHVRTSVRENILSDPTRITEDDYREMIEERGRGWVCEIDGKIIGFSIIDLHAQNIWALFLLPEYESRGIGKKLHDLMMEWAATQNIASVWLSTSSGTRAVGFYRKIGWTEIGFLDNGEVKFEWFFDR
ncbi:MAG: GNAT family N-acetyltransferase [Saprospiraceae bacterium]